MKVLSAPPNYRHGNSEPREERVLWGGGGDEGGDSPQLAIKKYVCWHGIQYLFRECELFAIPREYGLLVWIPKSSHSIVFFKHPPYIRIKYEHTRDNTRSEGVEGRLWGGVGGSEVPASWIDIGHSEKASGHRLTNPVHVRHLFIEEIGRDIMWYW